MPKPIGEGLASSCRRRMNFAGSRKGLRIMLWTNAVTGCLLVPSIGEFVTHRADSFTYSPVIALVKKYIIHTVAIFALYIACNRYVDSIHFHHSPEFVRRMLSAAILDGVQQHRSVARNHPDRQLRRVRATCFRLEAPPQ
jgi:hypothetical protein